MINCSVRKFLEDFVQLCQIWKFIQPEAEIISIPGLFQSGFPLLLFLIMIPVIANFIYLNSDLHIDL